MSDSDARISCDGKQAFSTYREGDKAITRIRRGDKDAGPIVLYRCAHCPDWHIGTRKHRGRGRI